MPPEQRMRSVEGAEQGMGPNYHQALIVPPSTTRSFSMGFPGGSPAQMPIFLQAPIRVFFQSFFPLTSRALRPKLIGISGWQQIEPERVLYIDGRKRSKNLRAGAK